MNFSKYGQYLKSYFLCDHRIGRVPYIIALVLYFLAIFLLGSLLWSKIPSADRPISIWANISGILVLLAFLPSVAMRLKDLHYSPKLALLLLILPVISLVARIISGVPMAFSTPVMIISVIAFIAEILLAGIPGKAAVNIPG